MPRKDPATLVILTCKRCKYKWVSRKLEKNSLPVRCARCKSSKWDKPVVNKEQSRLVKAWHARQRAIKAEKK